jgi:hypothetical protein
MLLLVVVLFKIYNSEEKNVRTKARKKCGHPVKVYIPFNVE